MRLHSVKTLRGFPGGPVVRNPSSSAGDVGLMPGSGIKIPQAKGPRAATKTQHSQISLKRINGKKIKIKTNKNNRPTSRGVL